MEVWPNPGGSIERLVADGVRCTVANLKARGESLTTEHLEYFAMLAIASQLERPDGPYHEIVAFGTAAKTIASFLGNDWTNDHVYGSHTDIARQHVEGRAFLKAESADGSFDKFKLMYRTESLAELLFNYQSVPGIDFRISTLKRDNLEAALGELECFKLVANPDFNAKFVIPTGTKGADYDCESQIAGDTVCCEIKTKKETLDYKASTVRQTIEAASKQLPRGRPGMVFLKIPEHWLMRTSTNAIVDEAIRERLGRSTRLLAVVLVWTEWIKAGDGCAVQNRFVATLNKRCAFYSPIMKDLPLYFGTKTHPNWVRFPVFLDNNLSRLTELAKAHLPTVSAFAALRRE